MLEVTTSDVMGDFQAPYDARCLAATTTLLRRSVACTETTFSITMHRSLSVIPLVLSLRPQCIVKGEKGDTRAKRKAEAAAKTSAAAAK